MKLRFASLFAGALAATLLGGALVSAAEIRWSYNWTPAAPKIDADLVGTGHLNLSNSFGNATGNTRIVASNITTNSTQPYGSPATFTNSAFALNLALTDGALALTDPTNATRILTFTGHFNGDLSSVSANIDATFDSPATQSVVIGNNKYTVDMAYYSPPGPPDSFTAGAFGARADVTVAPVDDGGGSGGGGGGGGGGGANEVPEPSSMVLATLGLSAFGTGWWLKRRKKLALKLA
jgi:hypothetical protein